MTIAQLYALYRAGHAEARTVSDGGVLRAFEISVRAEGLTALERLILEFALHEATNGTPARSRASFDRAVEQGADLLIPLGLRVRDAAAIPRRGDVDPARSTRPRESPAERRLPTAFSGRRCPSDVRVERQ
jgi:hypothetical protein